MFRLIFVFVIMFLILDLFMYIVSIFTSKKIMKKYPSLHIIGFKDGVIWLGKPSDSKVNPIGLVPVCKARCFDYGKLIRCGSVKYVLKPRFSFSDGIPYKCTITDIKL